jgi:hypothetical protein
LGENAIFDAHRCFSVCQEGLGRAIIGGARPGSAVFSSSSVLWIAAQARFKHAR